ncbi:hypothetical protein GCM10020229_04200 [Kitasatospora albolonga]|uniref:DUF2264 domain-containing protein n=1 Tax=Kitasatospora albolonga TaxID=68173 RepID=UPI00337E52AF
MPAAMPAPFPLPAEDRALSPHTGWTRAHWEAAADGLLAAVRPYASPGLARIDLPGPRPSWSGPASDGLEGYARTFLLAAFRTAGARGEDPTGLLERYAAGLATGTDPASAEAWPPITDRGPADVEAASIALALRTHPPLALGASWTTRRPHAPRRPLAGRRPPPRTGRQQLGTGRSRSTVAGLSCGRARRHRPRPAGGGGGAAPTPRPAGRRTRGLAKLDGWYLGEGWYTDWPPARVEHYIRWALHLYPLLGDAHLSATPSWSPATSPAWPATSTATPQPSAPTAPRCTRGGP